MRTLIFDIKTIGEEWNDIDAVTQNMLTKSLDRNADTPEEWVTGIDALQHDLGLSPLTGSIISLALYDLERAQGAVYYVSDDVQLGGMVDGFVCKARSEALLVREFWEGAREYDTFVTFAGRSFDVPFLLHRSVANGVRPTRELMKYRFLSQQSTPFHIDLLDELTFYGATRRAPLQLFCRMYDIQTAKDTSITGADVTDLYQSGHHHALVRYTIADVVATAQLYAKWLENLAPESFINTVDL